MYHDTMKPLSLNGYRYTYNNPVIKVDPDGEFASNLGARAKQALKNY